VSSGGNLDQSPPDTGDEVQFGGREEGDRHRRPWLSGLLLVAVVVAAIGFLIAHYAPHHRMPRPAVAVTDTGKPILGVTAGWELFARGPDALVAIALAKGKVTRTEVPALESGNPGVSFVLGPHEVVIRSYDFVPGYVIRDGAPAQRLTGTMASGGQLIPGSVPGEAWQQASGSSTSPLVLVTLAGRKVGPTITLRGSESLAPTMTADGRGDLLVLSNLGQWYDAGPGWFHRVHGDVIATGPNHWLMLSCPHGQPCRNVVVDTANGTQQTVPGIPLRSATYIWPPNGVISPNGTMAAIMDSGAPPAVHLINLSSGADTRLALPVIQQPVDESMAWSPDGRWLFVTQDGKLIAVNDQTGRITNLGVTLPYVTQVAVRPAAGLGTASQNVIFDRAIPTRAVTGR